VNETNAAPMKAPASVAKTAMKRRPNRDPSPPAIALSAAMPVLVKVSTVVVRSGTASLRAVDPQTKAEDDEQGVSVSAFNRASTQRGEND